MTTAGNAGLRRLALEGPTRRELLELGVAGFVGLGGLGLGARVLHPAATPAAACDHVILVWLSGGPSQLDTFDPHPQSDHNDSPAKAIATDVDGIQIAEHFPKLARRMKHAGLIRTMTNDSGEHVIGAYQMHTGYKPLPGMPYPSLGAIVLSERGRANPDMPGYVVLDAGGYYVSKEGVIQGISAGHFGGKAAPFFIGDTAKPVPNLAHPAAIGDERFARRRGLLERMNADFVAGNPSAGVQDADTLHRDALRLMESRSREAFDAAKEPEARRKPYGDNAVGRCLLIARRLVEQGVRFVEVSIGGWDHHGFGTKNSVLPKDVAVPGSLPHMCGELDGALSSLIDDLHASGLLKRTMIVVTGEFGRSPELANAIGRGHYGPCWSTLVAGGGFKGGYVHGVSDHGVKPKEKPVRPGDLHATMYKLLGIDHKKEYVALDRPIKLVDQGTPINDLIA